MLKKNKDVVKLSSLLGPGSICDGDFVSAGSARIDGTVNGNVSVEGTLILGSTGVINGSVEAKSVQIAGEVNGNIYAPEHAELTSTAKVIGDLATAVIVIDENAVFQGQIDMSAGGTGHTHADELSAENDEVRNAAELKVEQIMMEVGANEDIIQEIISEDELN